VTPPTPSDIPRSTQILNRMKKFTQIAKGLN
jgi:hypothetical protein